MVLRTLIAFAAALLAGSAFGASREENLGLEVTPEDVKAHRVQPKP